MKRFYQDIRQGGGSCTFTLPVTKREVTIALNNPERNLDDFDRSWNAPSFNIYSDGIHVSTLSHMWDWDDFVSEWKLDDPRHSLQRFQLLPAIAIQEPSVKTYLAHLKQYANQHNLDMCPDQDYTKFPVYDRGEHAADIDSITGGISNGPSGTALLRNPELPKLLSVMSRIRQDIPYHQPELEKGRQEQLAQLQRITMRSAYVTGFTKQEDGTILDSRGHVYQEEMFKALMDKEETGYTLESVKGYILHAMRYMDMACDQITTVLDAVDDTIHKIPHVARTEPPWYSNYATKQALREIMERQPWYSEDATKKTLGVLDSESFDWLTVEDAAHIYRVSPYADGYHMVQSAMSM